MQVKESKKLAGLLLASFVVVASFTGIVGYISTNITRDSINQLVGQQYITIAFSALNKIDISVADKISELKKLGKEAGIQNALTPHNMSDRAFENTAISDRLAEKIVLDGVESGHPVYETIILRNVDGRVVARSGGAGDATVEKTTLDLTREHRIFLSDVYYDAVLDGLVYDVGVMISDPRGQTIGSIQAVVNFREIIALVEESKANSQITSSEFDLFYYDGSLLYSTVERSVGYSVTEFVTEFEEVYQDIDAELEELDGQYDRIMQEFGYAEPELSEDVREEMEERLTSLDGQYYELFEELMSEETTEERAAQLERQIMELGVLYDEVFEDHGFAIPLLSEAEQAEFDEKLAEIDQKYAEIYGRYDFDFIFGGKGFAIAGSDSEGETLHAYSRQRGHMEFGGHDWILAVHAEMDDILQDVNHQRDVLLAITVAMTAAAAILGMLFSGTLYRQHQRINESEKMYTIGRLSSNIAHDLRNPLGTIRSSTERIGHQNKDQNPAISGEVERINRSVKRMSHQIEGVLNYVRTTPLIIDEHSVLEMLAYAKDSIDVPGNIAITLPQSDVKIECDREKMEVTFENMLLNAAQAIGDGKGTISVRVDHKGQDVCIIFENDGPAIPDEVLQRVFDPLFTTRMKGTGLGLSSCKNIVEQHRGRITAKQSPVTFTVQIPRRQK